MPQPLHKAFLEQALRNLRSLSAFSALPNCCDWQITVCFYTSVHLLKSHLARHNETATKHEMLKHKISDNNTVIPSPCIFPERGRLAHRSLEQLSHESRYVFSDGGNPSIDVTMPIFSDGKLLEAVRKLNTVMEEYNGLYPTDFPITKIILAASSPSSIPYFTFEQRGAMVAAGGTPA